ncbi:MAG: hypothetical protein ACJAZT_000432 [Gammaproteobacteria bacterium]|jgi:hypothetical protein
MVDAEMVFLDKIGAGVKRNYLQYVGDAIGFLFRPHFAVDGMIAAQA